ncbi:hypothetical protein CJ030_MR2G012427 [Morella rubra]|uniref:Uncharacterized protein n=1 Tax=Morella rubra TaxID=262757 RepID=A0A6A1WKP1_9ROSI|nr:hypothetical protein CJ030_MR2G012427 [Morella rubra]
MDPDHDDNYSGDEPYESEEDNPYNNDEPYESEQDEQVDSVPGDTESNRTDNNDQYAYSSDELYALEIIDEGRRRRAQAQPMPRCPIPQNTSILTGAMHLAEILNNPNEHHTAVAERGAWVYIWLAQTKIMAGGFIDVHFMRTTQGVFCGSKMMMGDLAITRFAHNIGVLRAQWETTIYGYCALDAAAVFGCSYL